MKKIISIFFSIVMFCSLFAFSQERENPVIEVQIGPPLGCLTEAVGWAFDQENKEWKSSKNKILSFWRGYKSQQLGVHNFDFIESRKVTFKDQEFYILIMQSTTGDFKYPSIEKGWYTVKEHKYWVFTPGEWARLRYLKDRQDNYVIMLLVDDGYEVGSVDLEKLRKNLKLDEVEKRLARNDEFPVFVYPIEDKQLIQFRLNVSHPSDQEPRKPEDKLYYEIPESAYFQLFNIEKIPYGTPIGEEVIAANREKLVGKTIQTGYNWYKKQDEGEIIKYDFDGKQHILTLRSLNGKKTQEFRFDDLDDIKIVKKY